MASNEEYAWLSELVYNGSRTDSNDLKLKEAIGEEWQELKYISDSLNATGFSVGVYQF